MTAVGKIFVFLNFVISIVISALIVLVFVTRTNWKTEYEKVKQGAAAAEAAFKAEYEQHLADLQKKDEVIAKLQNESNAIAVKLQQVETSLAALQTDYDKIKNAQGSETTNHRLVQAELERISKERDVLRQEKQQRDAQIVSLSKDLNDQRKEAVSYEIAYKSAQQRNEKLLERNEQLVSENRDLKFRINNVASGATPGTGQTSVLASPPPQLPRDVRGEVTSVHPNGLTQISIGTDQGVQVGAVLDVYRLVPNSPKDSKYLGKLLVRAAEPKAAVGQFTAMNDTMPRPGDTVGNDLSPGR